MKHGAVILAACLILMLPGGSAWALSDITVEQELASLVSGVSVVTFSPMGSGEFAYQWFVVRNDGDATLSGLSANVTGANAGDFAAGALPTSLAPGVSVSFVVSFSPQAFGERAATLSIASNDPDENPFLLSLHGEGLDPIGTWRQFYFGNHLNTGAGADTADPDQDGVSNLLEFAFCSDPLAPQDQVAAEQSGTVISVGLPNTRMSASSSDPPRILFVRRTDYLTAGLGYVPKFSGNLVDWVDPSETPTVLAQDEMIQILSVPYPVLPNNQRANFFHLTVNHAE